MWDVGIKLVSLLISTNTMRTIEFLDKAYWTDNASNIKLTLSVHTLLL